MNRPQPSPNQSSKWRNIFVLHRGYLCSKSLPLQARPGPLFVFSVYPQSLSVASPYESGDHAVFLACSLPLPLDLPTTGSHSSNRTCLLCCRCCSPIWPPKPQRGPYTGFSISWSHSRPLSPTGKGGAVPESAPAPVCWIRPKLPHTAPTGRGTGFAGVISLLDPQNRTQARV